MDLKEAEKGKARLAICAQRHRAKYGTKIKATILIHTDDKEDHVAGFEVKKHKKRSKFFMYNVNHK